MKKLFVFFLFLAMPVFAETLNASASYEEILQSFFGTWHVTSKLESTNNLSMFNKMSVDIWNLSGVGNVLILENGLTGAKSSIKVENAQNCLDGKKLKFTRVKEFTQGGYKYKHTESPEFILNGKIFRGYDTFKVEKFDLSGNLLSSDIVKYKVVGQKIAGD